MLVVDVQTLLVESKPYRVDSVVADIGRLIGQCRSQGVEVVYVRHDAGEGSDLAMGSDGWQIYDAVSPEPGEKVVEKRFTSSFLHTDLKEYLKGKGVETIILTGMQTEYCIDATCKAAFEHGFQLIIPEETHTTFDNEYLPAERLHHYYTHKMWNKRFAEVLPLSDLEQRLQAKA